MHRGLLLVTSIKSVDFDSSESTFGTSVNSATLVWASEIFPSGSWMSSYIPSTSDIISICNVVVEISEVLEYSFPSLKSWFFRKTIISLSIYWAVIYGVKPNITYSINNKVNYPKQYKMVSFKSMVENKRSQST